MIYLLSKIVVSLLASLGIGFGVAWMLQMHLAARLREQLNSVIFETKSRIPQLESEITNRDQTIDGLREELASKPKAVEQPTNQAGSKEQEKQIDELRQQVIDLENELRMARGVTEEEAVFELDEEDRVHTEEPELMSDDEFLADIQDIFEDADDSIEAFGSSSQEQAPEEASKASAPNDAEQVTPADDDDTMSIEEELQNELEGWDKDDAADAEENVDLDEQPSATEGVEHTVAPRPEMLDDLDNAEPKPPLRSGPVDLKAELLDLEEEIKNGADNASKVAASQQSDDLEKLRSEIEDLTEARRSLNEIVDTQAKEMAGLQQQRDLQEKSLTVLNQQLELARMANERILREMRQLKDEKAGADDASQSATGS